MSSVVFFGTPEFAVSSLKILFENNFKIAAVVTVPDKAAGRGQKISTSAVKDYAVEKGLKLLQPSNLKDESFLDELKELNADLFVIVAFRMLPEAVWKMPPMGTFNLHGSLLPQYRGAAPINWAVINGEKETGVTTFFLQHEIDTGNIIFREAIPLKENETAGELHDRMKEIGANLVLKTAKEIFGKKVKTFQQSEFIKDAALNPAPKLNKENTKIDITKSPQEVKNLINGLNPFPGAHARLNKAGEIDFSIKIYSATAESEVHNNTPGIIETDNKTFLKVFLNGGYILINELQLSGRNRINVRDFLNGTKITGEWTLT